MEIDRRLDVTRCFDVKGINIIIAISEIYWLYIQPCDVKVEICFQLLAFFSFGWWKHGCMVTIFIYSSRFQRFINLKIEGFELWETEEC